MSLLTNFLVDDLNEESTEGGIIESFNKTLTGTNGVFPFCICFPQVRFFICPPNLRLKPSWYPRLRPSILRVLHQFLAEKPPNLTLLDDFSVDLEPDLIPFTPFSGVNYVQSIVDQSCSLIQKPPMDPVIRFG